MNKIPRVLRWILGGLVVFEIVYVVAGVFLVHSGQVDRWVNNKPEKRTITFDRAWTFIPGLAHVGGVRVVNQGRGNQLEVVVARATAFVNPLELIGKRVHILALQARGVEFRFRTRPKTREEAEERAELVPPIEGISFEPYSGPPKSEKKKKGGWTIVFTGARVRGVREVWIDALRLRGLGDVAASVTVGLGSDKRVSIRSADVRYPDVELLASGTTVARDVGLRVRGKMEPFFTKQTKGTALLELISASIELEGTSSGRVLNRYFAKTDWLEFESEPRRITAQLDVERGQIRAGGHLELEEGLLSARFAGFIAEGQATARLETVPAEEGEGADAKVDVSFSEYGMRRLVEGPPVMKGTGLQIAARSPANLAQIPPEEFEGRIELGKAEFPDLTFMNEMLPRGGGVKVKSGHGSVHGGFATGDDAVVSGSVKILTEDLVLEAGEVDNAGDVEVTVEVPDGNLRERTFAVDGTRIEFRDFAFTSTGSAEDLPDWQGRFEVTEGDLDLGDTPGLAAHLGLSFSDTRPLVAFLSRDKPMKGWKENLLLIEEITGEGVAEMAKETVTIRHFGVRGESLDIRLRGLLGPTGAFGKARAKYGILKAGFGFEGQERKLKLIGVGSWYKKDDIPGMPPLLPEFEEPARDEEDESEQEVETP